MTHPAADQTDLHDIVVIGASAGGVETLQRLVAALPAGLPLAFLVVLHIAPHGSHLPEILTRAGSYEAAHPQDGDPLPFGRIVVAPPDMHLLLENGVIRLGRGDRYEGARPAIDPLFESAAAEFGPRVVGIVLSGGLHDGAAGLAAVKAHGGVAVVQDPAGGPPSVDAGRGDRRLPGRRRAADRRDRDASRQPRFVTITGMSDEAVDLDSASAPVDDLDALIRFVKDERGFDFTGYKRATLGRRVTKRMQATGSGSYADYAEYLSTPSRRVHRALQHDPDQRHDVLPRPPGVGVPRRGDRPAPARAARRLDPDPALVRRLRDAAKRRIRSRSSFARRWARTRSGIA